LKTATEIGAAILERLAAQAAANRASGDRLLAEVRPIWEQFPMYSAKEILREMMRRNLPTGRPRRPFGACTSCSNGCVSRLITDDRQRPYSVEDSSRGKFAVG